MNMNMNANMNIGKGWDKRRYITPRTSFCNFIYIHNIALTFTRSNRLIHPSIVILFESFWFTVKASYTTFEKYKFLVNYICIVTTCCR